MPPIAASTSAPPFEKEDDFRKPTTPPFAKGGLGGISEEEQPFELPQGWEWARLNDFVLSILSGGTPSKSNSKFWNGDIPWASVKDLNVEKFLNKTQDYISKEGLEAGSKLANKGDLLICTRMGLGKIAIAAIDVAINQDLKALKITSLLDVDYFINFYSTLKIIGSGMTVAGIRQDELLSYCVPTPPLAEQHRIVAKVDELMALCDQLENQHSNAAEAHEKLVSHLLGTLTQSPNTVSPLCKRGAGGDLDWQRIAAHFDTLFTTEASIEALKQTLLQLAVMGKLVPQDASDEPASELLERIQAEKAKLIAEGEIKKDKPLSPITEEEKPFALPEGWEWGRLGAALDITGGVTLGRKIAGADLVELPYLRVANVQRGHLVLDSIKTVEIRQSELSRYQLLNDDLLVTEGGDWDKVGRTAIWNSEIENCLHQNHIFRMRGITKGLLSSWIEMYMNSIAKAYFQAASKQTTNLASINMTQLKNCLLAVPTLQEQHRIVAKVDELIEMV